MTHPTESNENEGWERLKETAARRWLIQERYGISRRDAVAEIVAVQSAAQV